MMPRPAGMGLPIVAVALLCGVATACEDRGAAGWAFEGQVSRTSLWEYHDALFWPPCPSLLDLLDEHARTVGAKIGLTVADGRPLRYYRFKSDTELATGCPGRVTGCAYGDAVLATEPFHAHEQAHAYVARAWDSQSIGLLNEGEATALSCDPPYVPVKGMSPREALGAGDWRPFLYLYGNSASGYYAAGHWITYLARNYGWQKIKELHRRALPGISADDFAVEFARVFPISMDQAWSEALSGSNPSCDNEWACHATSMYAGEVAHPDCDGELHRSIDVSEQSGIVLSHRRGALLLKNCAEPAATVYELKLGSGAVTTHWTSLPPGRYALSGDPIPSEVTLVSDLPSPLFAATCEQAGQVSLTSGQFTFIELLPGAIDGCLRLHGDDAQYRMAFQDVKLSASGTAALCDSDGASCVPISTSGASTVTVGADSVLRIQAAQCAPPAPEPWGRILFYPLSSADAGI